MVNKNKISTCCTCGHSWQTGYDGRHSCSDVLTKKVEVLEKSIRTYVRKEMVVCNLRSDEEVVKYFIKIAKKLEN